MQNIIVPSPKGAPFQGSYSFIARHTRPDGPGYHIVGLSALDKPMPERPGYHIIGLSALTKTRPEQRGYRVIGPWPSANRPVH